MAESKNKVPNMDALEGLLVAVHPLQGEDYHINYDRVTDLATTTQYHEKLVQELVEVMKNSSNFLTGRMSANCVPNT